MHTSQSSLLARGRRRRVLLFFQSMEKEEGASPSPIPTTHSERRRRRRRRRRRQRCPSAGDRRTDRPTDRPTGGRRRSDGRTDGRSLGRADGRRSPFPLFFLSVLLCSSSSFFFPDCSRLLAWKQGGRGRHTHMRFAPSKKKKTLFLRKKSDLTLRRPFSSDKTQFCA